MTRSHRTPARHAGFTLPELLIGIVLMGIFGLTLLGFYTSSLTSARTNENQAVTQTEGRGSIERLSRELRQAISPDAGLTPPVQSMNATSIVFYYDGSRNPASLTTRPKRVRYQIVGTTLVRDQADPVGAAPPYTYGAYGPQETLATGVQNGAVPLFAGFDTDGSALGASLAAPATTSLAQIEIRLLLQYRNGQSNATLELTTNVVPRNPRTTV